MGHIDQEKVLLAIENLVKTEEQVGDHGGGSGHLSHISVSIDPDIEVEVRDSDSTKYAVAFKYTKFIETEFTYYPDNPPHEYFYEQRAYLDRNYLVTGFEKKTLIRSSWDLDVPDFDPEDNVQG